MTSSPDVASFLDKIKSISNNWNDKYWESDLSRFFPVFNGNFSRSCLQQDTNNTSAHPIIFSESDHVFTNLQVPEIFRGCCMFPLNNTKKGWHIDNIAIILASYKPPTWPIWEVIPPITWSPENPPLRCKPLQREEPFWFWGHQSIVGFSQAKDSGL